MTKKTSSILLGVAKALLSKSGSSSKGSASSAKGTTAAKAAAPAGSGAAAISIGGKTAEKMQFGPYNWIVLERKGNTALLITEGIIERGPYHNAAQGTTWEGCGLREYLNGKFLEKFDPADQAKIIEVTNQNPDNPWYKTMGATISAQAGGKGVKPRDAKGGNPTKDKVFLLSIDEVCRYFGDSTARLKNKGFTQQGGKTIMDKGTSLGDTTRISDKNDKNRIAIMPGALSTFRDKKDIPFRWWLRSPGEADILAAEVNVQGHVKITGSQIWASGTNSNDKSEMGGIRPAVWING